MIKEVLVVEGKMDVVAIDKAVEADCIIFCKCCIRHL